MKKLLILLILISSKNLYSQGLGLRLTTSPSFQLSLTSFDFVPKINYSIGLLYELNLAKSFSVKTGFEFQYLGTNEHFPSCGHLTMLDELLGNYNLIEVPVLFSLGFSKLDHEIVNKPVTFGISVGRILHDPTEGKFNMNYFSFIAGYNFRSFETSSFKIDLGVNIKTTRISKCDGFSLSPGISTWITRNDKK